MNIVITTILVALVATTKISIAGEVNHRAELVHWLREQGGFFHPDLEIRRFSNDNNEGSSYGIFAKNSIKAEETLLRIPSACLLRSDSEDICDTARILYKETQRGDASPYAPYIRYLVDTQLAGQLPSVWSVEGKDLLNHLIGDSNAGDKYLIPLHSKQLPPQDATDHYSWEEDCGGHPELTKEYMYVLQRGWDDLVIPVYDMMNHRNGKYLNTVEVGSVHDRGRNFVTVEATRDIQPGEQLHTTYNLCQDCVNRFNDYGTPEIMRDYGFIEQYPQRWIFHGTDVAFELDKDENVDGEDELRVWLIWKPSKPGIQYLEAQLERLEYFAKTKLMEREKAIPDHEWDIIQQYHHAVTVAITSAIQVVGSQDTECDLKQSDCTIEQIYNNLKNEKDTLPYHKHLCDKALPFDDYNELEENSSHYQIYQFFEDPLNKDMCLSLGEGEITQICTSYRPHYHEPMVHYPARFLDDVERVAFIGGGDSMLLHEILKYPSIEKVIGLELDQKITRKAFQYFGAQPHWDNDKVEWWYGDASKTMLMLPRHYFGSFDLVLIDLSETVMAMSVTEHLDIFGALALLLNRNGIIVKNEHYFKMFSRIFDYTVNINMYDVPKICKQAMILGSFNNDFLLRQQKDRNVHSLFLQPYRDADRYHMWHDYSSNKRPPVHCNDTDKNEEEVEQEQSSGIIMILEAEQAFGPLSSSEDVKDALVRALENEGLSMISAPVVASHENGSMVAVIMQEGYVMARTWPEHNYCAFDIHFWGSFDKLDKVKRALVAAVGSEKKSPSSSSYRIVAGGMFGLSTWKEDNRNLGPHLDSSCDDQPVSPKPVCEKEQETSENANIIDTILEQSLTMVMDNNIAVAVFCGETGPCESLDALKKNGGHVGMIAPIWTCPGIHDIDQTEEGGGNRMLECQHEILSKLKESVDEAGRKFRLIIVDSEAPLAMGQIIHKIFSKKQNYKMLLSDDVMVTTATIDDETKEWRRNLLESFRKDIIIYDPVFRAEVLFNSSDSCVEMGVISSGDPLFIQHLTDAVAKIEKDIGRVSQIRSIRGGFYKFQPDFDPEVQASHEDYDQSSALKQWMSQRPLAFQTVFQLGIQEEMDSSVMAGDRVEWIDRESEEVFLGTVTSVNIKEDTFEIDFDDGDKGWNLDRRDLRKIGSNRNPKIHDTLESIFKKAENVELHSALLTPLKIRDAIESIFKKTENVELHEFRIGDGFVLIGFWPGGSVAVLWDGRVHVDINLFTFIESVEVADNFINQFKTKIPPLEIALRDEQPRGYGLVVNMLDEINQTQEIPKWASLMKTSLE